MHVKKSLNDIQKYVQRMTVVRGFENETISETMMLFSEELGELAKAIRKNQNIKTDPNSNLFNVSNELADLQWYLFVLANKLNVNMDKAFGDKEKINNLRKWE